MAFRDEDLFQTFENLGIATKTTSHEPIFTSAEGAHLKEIIPGAHCKCLFLATKKDEYFLLVVLDTKRIDLKGLSHILKVSRLGFASDERLMEKLGVTPGTVTPFAMLNNQEKDVRVILDHDMMQHETLNYHPLRNDRTTSIAREDLLKFLSSLNVEPWVLELPKREEKAA